MTRFEFPSLSADDIFISYSRKDGNTYAIGLADELTKKGFSCFFDRLGTDADRNLPPSLTRKVKSCAMLVVVGSPGARASTFVAQEVEEFAKANGTARAVPIYFGGLLEDATWKPMLVGIAPEVEDINALATGNPSPSVVSRIEKSFNYLRSKDRLRRYTVGATVILALLVLASVGAAMVARARFVEAQQATAAADSAKAEAEKQQRLAEAATRRATDEREKADRETLNAKAAGLVSVARGMVNSDPLTASLLLTEAQSPSEPSEGVAAARELLGRFVTKATLRHDKGLSDDGVGIHDVDFSPKGTHVATAGNDKTARVWPTDRTAAAVVLKGHEREVLTVRFSPDGEFVVTASNDGTARVWRADGTGSPVILRNSEWIKYARFSPDGRRVLTYGGNTAAVQNADGSGRPVEFRHPSYVGCATFSPDGSLVLTGAGDGLGRVWHADGSGAPVVLRGGEDPVIAADFSPDGTLVAFGSLRGGARVRHPDGSGEAIVLGDPRAQVQLVKFSPNGRRVAIMALEKPLEIWSTDGQGTPVRIAALSGIGGPAHTIAFTRDGTRVLVSWHDGTAEVWNADGSGTPIVLRGHSGSLSAAAFSPNEREIVTGSYDGTARLWTRSERDDPIVLNGAEINFRAHFSPDGHQVVAVERWRDKDTEHRVLVWTVNDTKAPIILRGHTDGVADVRFSPDGTKVLTSSFDGTSRIWSLDGSRPPIVLGPHDGPVRRAAFTPDGTHVVTVVDQVMDHFGVADGTIRVWAADGVAAPIVMRGHKGAINSLALSSDGLRIVTSGKDATVRVWPIDGSKDAIVLRGHKYGVTDARFAKSGQRIVSVGEDRIGVVENADGTGDAVVWNAGLSLKSIEMNPDETRAAIISEDGVFLWSLGDSTTVRPLRGHAGLVNSVRFSADGKYLVTASSDGSARVWLADGTGEPLVLSTGDRHAVYWAEFSADHTRVLTVSSTNWQAITNMLGRVWTIGWKELLAQLRERTAECLTIDQRLKYLGESASDATARVTECQRAFGRPSGP